MELPNILTPQIIDALYRLNDARSTLVGAGYTVKITISINDDFSKLMTTIDDHISRSQLIAAIKDLRAATNYGLREAKEAIEQYRDYNNSGLIEQAWANRTVSDERPPETPPSW